MKKRIEVIGSISELGIQQIYSFSVMQEPKLWMPLKVSNTTTSGSRLFMTPNNYGMSCATWVFALMWVDCKRVTLLLQFDCSKAFDTVCHVTILKKLKKLSLIKHLTHFGLKCPKTSNRYEGSSSMQPHQKKSAVAILYYFQSRSIDLWWLQSSKKFSNPRSFFGLKKKSVVMEAEFWKKWIFHSQILVISDFYARIRGSRGPNLKVM